MLHFEFRIQLENQSSSLNPAQKAVATRLSGMSDENGDHGRLEVETRQKPRGTDCEYTMLSQSTMVCPTNYAKNSKLKRQHIKTRKLLGPLLYLFLIDDIFFNNLIVMAVNPVQTKLFPLTSCRREKKGKGRGEGFGEPHFILWDPAYDTVTKITRNNELNISNHGILWLTQWRNAHGGGGGQSAKKTPPVWIGFSKLFIVLY